MIPRGRFQVWLCDATGKRLRLMTGYKSLTYSRVNPVSGVGSFTLTCGPQYDEIADIACLMEIWRSPLPGVVYRHEGTYILEKFTALSSRERSIGGDHVNKLLRFRVVNAFKGTTAADKDGPADDLMKGYVREQLGSLAADTSRDFNTWFPLTVEANFGQGPTVTKEASHAFVLETVQALVKAAAEHDTDPTWLTFEVANTGHDLQFGLQFRTSADYRNLDRGLTSVSPLALSLYNALSKLERERDHSREQTRALVGGAGGNTGRVVKTVRDVNREGLAPWWRRETWVDGGDETVTAVLKEKGFRKLRDGRPVDKFKATLRPHPSVMYGGNLDLGDKVVVDFQRLWEARVESVTVTTDGGKENIDLKLEAIDA